MVIEVTDEDLRYAKVRADIEDRFDLIFENYTFEQLLEMNDLDERTVINVLYMEGFIKEPEAFLP